MPQDIVLEIPFPARINPHTEAVLVRHMEWLKAAGFLSSDENIERYLTWRLVELAGRFYPDALEDDLVLGAQGQAFFFFFDDLFDSHLGESPAAAYRICYEMAALARQSPDSTWIKPSFPLARLWLDHWCRAQEGMSAAWRERAARHWEDFFLSYVTEAANRKSGALLGTDQYLKLRRLAIATEGVLDTAERCGRFEAPPEIHQSMSILEIRDITAEVVVLANDLHSLEKDQVNGELNNAILLLRSERSYSQDEAVREVRDMVHKRIARFQQLGHEIYRLCDDFALSAEQRAGTRRFLEVNRACMRGNYDWGRTTDRYSKVGIQHVKRSPRIEDTVAHTTERRPENIRLHTRQVAPAAVGSNPRSRGSRVGGNSVSGAKPTG
ncbi:terpene synthase family protein [Streptomyces gobiensis]|uniref:terpene synthase family protein n=1 Tax=Streptomyces gobiensis TaxID=2875706 RepID=UPI001E4CF207|nr:hypothetical protein [Streptomyces gobiensis]UGY94499.1 hypothetical protein test1122_24060 [Streptomyces gobiensis]